MKEKEEGGEEGADITKKCKNLWGTKSRKNEAKRNETTGDEQPKQKKRKKNRIHLQHDSRNEVMDGNSTCGTARHCMA